MARTALTPLTPKGPYPGVVNAGDLAAAFTAADVANGNSFPSTGREIIIAQNTDGAAAHTVTITSIADERGRTGDITTYSIPANGFAAFAVTSTAGWKQSDGNIYLAASDAQVKFLILRF